MSKTQAKRASAHLFIEIPKQGLILLFFGLLFIFALHAWRDSRFLSTYECFVLLGLRAGVGWIFSWLEIDD